MRFLPDVLMHQPVMYDAILFASPWNNSAGIQRKFTGGVKENEVRLVGEITCSYVGLELPFDRSNFSLDVAT